MVGEKTICELHGIGVISDAFNRNAVLMTRIFSNEIAGMVVGLLRRVVYQVQLEDEATAFDGSLAVHVRHIVDDKITGPDLDVVAFVAKTLQVGATIYRSLGH